MTDDSEFKSIVRERMAITGESYTEALRPVLAAAYEAVPADKESTDPCLVIISFGYDLRAGQLFSSAMGDRARRAGTHAWVTAHASLSVDEPIDEMPGNRDTSLFDSTDDAVHKVARELAYAALCEDGIPEILTPSVAAVLASA